MPLIRKRKLLFFIPTIVAGLAIAIVFYSNNHLELRTAGNDALRSISILFALLAASSMALLNNFVNGLREPAKKQISEVRTILDEIADSKEQKQYEELDSLIDNYINPLRCLSLQEWLEFDDANNIRRKMPQKTLISLNQKDTIFFARYLLRLEDEFNELGVLFVRRIVARHHFETAKWSFGFLIASMIFISASYIVPSSGTWNGVIFVLEATLVSAVTTNAAFLFSFFINEASEEISIYSADDL